VDELLEEGNAFEAGVVQGVEATPDTLPILFGSSILVGCDCGFRELHCCIDIASLCFDGDTLLVLNIQQAHLTTIISKADDAKTLLARLKNSVL
jgi:hypothetical protein